MQGLEGVGEESGASEREGKEGAFDVEEDVGGAGQVVGHGVWWSLRLW